MNALKLLAAVAVACLVGPAVRADDKDDYAKKVVGKWEVTKADEGGPPQGAVIEFTADGKVKYTGKKGDAVEMHEGTYKVDGNKVTVTMKAEGKEESHTVTITKISDTAMSVDGGDGKKAELTKKK